MFGSEILEIAIGLIFIYLLFSVLVTLINEYIITISRLRARNLGRVIKNLLDDEDGGLKLSETFIKHPAIKYLSSKKHLYPSYIKSENFAKVVLDIVRTSGDKDKIGVSSLLDTSKVSDAIDELDKGKDMEGQNISYNSETLKLLKTFAKETSEDIDAFGKKLESWFDETMERGQGWYNRKVKLITFIVGFAMVVGLNVDTISIYKTLSENEGIRAEIIESAGTYMGQRDSLEIVTITDMKAAQDSLVSFYSKNIMPSNNLLGIGWTRENCAAVTDSPPSFLLAFLGWLITAFAISLGAPFWFDLLNKVMKLRSSIKQVSQHSSEPKKEPVG